MKLTLTGRHFEITPHLRQHVESKAEKLDHYTDHILEGEIVLFPERAIHVAEGKVHLSHTVIAARAEDHDVYAAVTELVDRMLVQLRRHTDWLNSRKKHGANHREVQ